MQPIINIASNAARRGGAIIMRYINRVDTLTVSKKRQNDFVSEVDRLAEEEIIATLRQAHPNYAILAEESGPQGEESDYQWIIDPLDGTTNFLHGFPQFGISIALRHKGVLEHAVVYDPMRNELFTASRGDGAYLDNRRLRVTRNKELDGTLIGTGFPFRSHDNLEHYLATFKAIMPTCAGIRRPGAACLDLAYVAAGRLDGFWEFDLSPWDIAAGVLLIQEAGGVVSDFGGNDNYLISGNLVGGGLKVHQALLDIIRSEIPVELQI